VVGAACGVVAAPAARARNRRHASVRIADAIPDLARSLASGLRAGRNIHLALAAAAEDAAEPLRDVLAAALARLDAGASLEQALEPLARTGPRARLLTDALLIGRAAGANLPGVLDTLAASIAERARIERDRRAATAQARMSAVIVAAMPAAFYAMVGAGARVQVAVLVGDPIGWTLLAAGVALEAAGLLWMRALLSGGER
jgi:tight adherence protein B